MGSSDMSTSVARVLAAGLEGLIAQHDGMWCARTPFDGLRVPCISIQAYAERIQKYAQCKDEALLYALILIDRAIVAGHLALTSFNVHRVLLVSVLVAVKFNDDFFYSNAYFGKIGGVALQEMNWLEVEFLGLIKFDLYVSEEEFEAYQKELSQMTEDLKRRIASHNIEPGLQSRAAVS